MFCNNASVVLQYRCKLAAMKFSLTLTSLSWTSTYHFFHRLNKKKKIMLMYCCYLSLFFFLSRLHDTKFLPSRSLIPMDYFFFYASLFVVELFRIRNVYISSKIMKHLEGDMPKK